jgi:hypothetical protein
MFFSDLCLRESKKVYVEACWYAHRSLLPAGTRGISPALDPKNDLPALILGRRGSNSPRLRAIMSQHREYQISTPARRNSERSGPARSAASAGHLVGVGGNASGCTACGAL